MLYIEWTRGGRTYVAQWHNGESLPVLTGRVFKFQADGDELETILEALRSTRKG